MKDLFETQTTGHSPVEEENELAVPMRLPLRDKDLPPIFREVVSNAPTSRKLPSFVACLSPLCALATRVRVKYYYDGQRISALLLQVVIEGPQSSGKQFAADIERLIMDGTLKARDQEQRREEQEYREKKRRRKANENIGEEPHTDIRVIPATISKTVIVKRSDYHERFLGAVVTFWMFAEELAQVTDAGKQGYSNLRTIMRTSYDFGSRFGMDFASDNSYSAIVDINICSMFCSTPSALDDYFDNKAIEGGNITRTVLCQLEDQIGADGAMFKPYTDEQMAVVNRTLSRMMDDTYTADGRLQPEMHLDMSWLDKDVRKWCVRMGTEALKAASVSMDVFRKRASVSAFRAATLCYYLYRLEGEVSDTLAQNRCRRIYLFMADYILSMMLKRWGKKYEELLRKREEKTPQEGQVKLIDRLSDVFSREQLRTLIKEHNVATPDRVLISQWRAKGLIETVEKFQYRKLY